MLSKYFFRIASSILFLGCISFSFIGSNCNEILDALGGSGDVVGTWRLSEQGGAQYDVCADEQIVFNSSQATLTCSSMTGMVIRGYTISGTTLSYDTGISYTYSIGTETDGTYLSMTGRNIGRILKYKKVISSDDKTIIAPKPTGGKTKQGKLIGGN